MPFCLLSCTPTPFWKGIYSKRKNLPPVGANSFLLDPSLGSKFFPFRSLRGEQILSFYKRPLLRREAELFWHAVSSERVFIILKTCQVKMRLRADVNIFRDRPSCTSAPVYCECAVRWHSLHYHIFLIIVVGLKNKLSVYAIIRSKYFGYITSQYR